MVSGQVVAASSLCVRGGPDGEYDLPMVSVLEPHHVRNHVPAHAGVLVADLLDRDGPHLDAVEGWLGMRLPGRVVAP